VVITAPQPFARAYLSCISGVEFLAASDVLQILIGEKLIEKYQIVASGYHENVFEAYLLKPVGKIVPHRVAPICHIQHPTGL
jgi:hypothetical protein